MAPGKKTKSAGLSTASFFNLKAEIAKQQDEVARNKAAGKSAVIGVQRPDKKPTVWARHNKGVSSRAARDIELEAVSKPTLESARAALERKAKIYDKLRKGKTGGLDDKQYEALLVDFDNKPVDEWESDSEDIDESLVVPQAPLDEEADPMVEYEDEFGRIRTARRSEVPRHLAPPDEEQLDDDEDIIIRNPVNHFPIYEPSAERVAEIAAAHSEANNPLDVHYDASREVRAKGAGFYQFSGDEETRRQQMEELKSARTETEKTREETGAVDLKPGEVEGMQDDRAGSVKSRAMEKRKREVEERRRMVEAKRRKTKGGEQSGRPSDHSLQPMASSAPLTSDPFEALETHSSANGGQMASVDAGNSSADAFLAQLEREIRNGRQ